LKRERNANPALPAHQPDSAEIADQLSVSRNTVKTHMRNLYAKLGTHRRAEAVARARTVWSPRTATTRH